MAVTAQTHTRYNEQSNDMGQDEKVTVLKPYEPKIFERKFRFSHYTT